MGPRRRRWRRRAAKAALAALAVAVLGLLASGGGEELLAAALAAWGEGRGAGGEWGMGEAEAGGVSVNGRGGNGAWPAGCGRGQGAWPEGGVANENWGDGRGAWGVLNGSSGGTNGGAGGGIGGPGVGIWGPGRGIGGPEGGTWGPGGLIGGPEGGIGGPEGEIGGPGGLIGDPEGVIGGPGGLIGGPGAVTGGPGGVAGDPGAPPVPPGCLGLLSGGSGALPEGPPGSPPCPRVLLSPPPCAAPGPFLLLLVPSALPHRQRRLAVRDTWGGPWRGRGSPPSRTVFVLGTSPSPAAGRQLLAEWRRHGDILQGDFGDTYAHLSLKTLLLLRWARSCCAAAPFLLKADDDVFVNVPAVATYLSAWPSRPARLYLGRVHWAAAPSRDPRSRHHVPEGVYAGRRFPPYCSGTAYVLSRQAAAALLAEAARVPLALPEDVWVGVCARRAGLRPRHSARFGGSWRFPAERCCLGRALLSAHRLSPAELRRVWSGLREGAAGCGAAPGALGTALALLRCRAMALREWLWGAGSDGGEGGE